MKNLDLRIIDKGQKMKVEDETKFGCIQCGKQFSQSSGLNTHVRAAHEMVKYPCDRCEYKATNNSALKRHTEALHDIFLLF